MDGPKLLTLSKDPALFLKNDFYAYIFTINLWDVILFQVRCYDAQSAAYHLKWLLLGYLNIFSDNVKISRRYFKITFYVYIFTINLWDVILFQVRCYDAQSAAYHLKWLLLGYLNIFSDNVKISRRYFKITF